jgi:hypothetical protein
MVSTQSGKTIKEGVGRCALTIAKIRDFYRDPVHGLEAA